MKHLISATAGLLACVCSASAEDASITLGDWTLRLAPSGEITGLAHQGGDQLVQPGEGNSLLRIAVVPSGKTPAGVPDSDFIACDKPEKRDIQSPAATFEYTLTPGPALRVRHEIRLVAVAGTTAVQRTITLLPVKEPVNADIALRVGNNLSVPTKERRIFTPRFNGQGEDMPCAPGLQWLWRLSGEARLAPGDSESLAIPMISESGKDSPWRLTHIADPFFTTGLRVAVEPAPRIGEFNCVYLSSKVPIRKQEQRTFWTVLQSGGPDNAMRAWYATALADVPAGPEWLHDVALQHYDYLSHGGQGWFEDIDALEKLVPRADRRKIVLALHGWYDMLGRYTFNEKTGKLDDEWTAFPSAPLVKKKFPTSEPVKMSKAEVHRRIDYARQRGFRVCLYFADGMTACEGAADVFSADQVLTWGGWAGPDTVGKPYAQNLAHPRVYPRYVNYLKALLAEYGDGLDAFVWDETFHVQAGTISSGENPEYLPRLMMRLVRECTQMVTRHRPNLAFLTSDCCGMTWDGKTFWTKAPPYAIMAHGCYQDSHCRPEVWPFGIFPNFRNVLWSCNWQAVTHWDYTQFGVENYHTPIATSNGWLDDKGIARLAPDDLAKVMTLFNLRKTQRQEMSWLTGPAPAFNP